MIHVVSILDTSGRVPAVTFNPPKDGDLNDLVGIVRQRDGEVHFNRLERYQQVSNNVLGSFHLSSKAVAFEALSEGIEIAPKTWNDSVNVVDQPSVLLDPSTQGHMRTIYLRHNDVLKIGEYGTFRIQLKHLTALMNHQESALVQVGSSLPEKNDFNLNEENGEFAGPTEAQDTHEIAQKINKVIAETPKKKRHKSLMNMDSSIDDDNKPNYADGLSIEAEPFENMPRIEENSLVLFDQHDSSESHAKRDPPTEEYIIESAYGLEPQRKQSAVEAEEQDEIEHISHSQPYEPHSEADVERDVHDEGNAMESNDLRAVTPPMDSDDSASLKRKRGRVKTYSSASKNKRTRLVGEKRETNDKLEQDELADLKTPQRLTRQQSSQDGATGTRGKISSYSGKPPRVMFSNSTILDEPTMARFFTIHGGKKVEQISKPFDLLVVGTGELKKRSKLIMAVVQNKPIVTDTWLTQSAKAGRFLDISDFASYDPEREREWKWNASAVRRHAIGELFLGKKLYITPSLRKEYGSDYKDVEEIARVAGAKRITSATAKQILKREDDHSVAIILGKDKDDPDCIPLLESGYHCFNRDFLPMSVLRDELQFDDDTLRIGNGAVRLDTAAAAVADEEATAKHTPEKKTTTSKTDTVKSGNDTKKTGRGSRRK